MKPVFSKEITILPSNCDYTGALGLVGAANLFMDIATTHAEQMNIGLTDLNPKNMFWLTLKTRIDLIKKPVMNKKVTLNTWPNKPSGIKSDRNYSITFNNEIYITGKTQWAIIDTVTGKLVKQEFVFPTDMEFLQNKAIDADFIRFDEDFDTEIIGSYIVQSEDIDLGGHMNNVAYIRTVLNLFSVKEQKEMSIKSFEIHFKKSCYEGNRIDFYTKKYDDSIHIKSMVKDETVALIAIRYCGLIK